jgi:hypothetical protein
VSGPLSGVRVVDCTTVVLGPWAAQQLGDLGADVVKIEPPEGDTTRQLGPMRNPDMGAFYLAVNRNKRSIVLDLKQEAARAVLRRLAEGADVLLHNYRPQAARRLGMSYEIFRAVNPVSSTSAPTASGPPDRTATSPRTTTSSRPPPAWRRCRPRSSASPSTCRPSSPTRRAR